MVEQSNVRSYLPDMYGYNLVSSQIDDDCGCLEEEWECPVGFMSFHLKPDGSADVAFDNGESEWEIELVGSDTDDFWKKLIQYIDALPYLDI